MNLKLALVAGICGIVMIAAQRPTVAQTQSLRTMLVHPSVAEAMGDAYGRAIVGGFVKLISDRLTPTTEKSKADTVSPVAESGDPALIRIKLVALAAKRIRRGVSQSLTNCWFTATALRVARAPH
jgi:hypothetical protein